MHDDRRCVVTREELEAVARRACTRVSRSARGHPRPAHRSRGSSAAISPCSSAADARRCCSSRIRWSRTRSSITRRRAPTSSVASSARFATCSRWCSASSTTRSPPRAACTRSTRGFTGRSRTTIGELARGHALSRERCRLAALGARDAGRHDDRRARAPRWCAPDRAQGRLHRRDEPVRALFGIPARSACRRRGPRTTTYMERDADPASSRSRRSRARWRRSWSGAVRSCAAAARSDRGGDDGRRCCRRELAADFGLARSRVSAQRVRVGARDARADLPPAAARSSSRSRRARRAHRRIAGQPPSRFAAWTERQLFGLSRQVTGS